MAEAGSESPGTPAAEHSTHLQCTLYAWESRRDEAWEAGSLRGMGEVARDLRVLMCLLKLTKVREVGKERIKVWRPILRDLRVRRSKNGFRWNWVR